MITYFLNRMGPVNSEFIKKYGDDWAMGRIDIMDVPDEPYGLEHAMDAIKEDEWYDLSEWLWNLETKEVWNKKQILDRYTQETGNTLTFLDRDEE